MDKIIVDNSILTKWRSCRLQAALRYIFHFTTPGEAAPLRAGTEVHTLLAEWLDAKGEQPDVALKGFLKRYRPWAKKHLLPTDRLWWVNVHRIMEARLATMARKWPFVHEQGRVEVGLTYELVSGVLFVGVMDAIRTRKVGGGLYGIDHKTSGSINQWWKDNQKYSSQYNGYDVMLYEEGYHELAGWYINGVSLRELNSSAAKCPKHKVAYAKCALHPDHLRHELLLLTKTPGSRKDWMRAAREYAQDFAEAKEKLTTVEQLRDLPMDGLWNGSCRNCDFNKWCRAGRPLHYLKEYVVQEWKPLEHIGGKKNVNVGE